MPLSDMGRCVVVGDVMMDVTARIATSIAYASDTPARISIQPGGSAAMTAAWLGSSGFPVTFVGCIGDDPFGRQVAATLTALGVQAHLTVSAGRPTGTCVILVDAQHERTMLPDTGANSDLDAGAVRALDLGRGDHVHLSGYVLLNPEARAAGVRIIEDARAAGASCSLDPASAAPLLAARDVVLELLPMFDILIANEDEAAVLSGGGDPVASLEVLGAIVPTVVVKRGGRGVTARSAGTTVSAAAPTVPVVDTTGAGDAFAAGFLAAWLPGASLAAAVDAGQSLAGVAVGRVGASPPGR